jgi:hypothetical protein
MIIEDIQGNAQVDEPDPPMESTEARPSTGPAKNEPTPEKAREAKQKQEAEAGRQG